MPDSRPAGRLDHRPDRRPEKSPPAPQPPPQRALVIGAGPAGMATVVALRARAVSVHHVDRTGQTGGAYARMHGGIRLTSPGAHIGLPGLPFAPSARYVEVREYRAYLARYTRVHGLSPERWLVERVGYRGREHFSVSMSRPPSARAAGIGDTGEYHSVVIATGMYDHRIRPNIPGLSAVDSPVDSPAGSTAGSTADRPAKQPTVEHAAEWRGARGVRDRRVLIVGGASSAVEIAEACARGGARVLVSTRSGRIAAQPSQILGVDLARHVFPPLSRLPPWITHRACEHGYRAPGVDLGFNRLQARGLIELHGPIARFAGRRAVFANGRSSAPIDRVILATGYRHASPFAPTGIARTAAGYPRTRACHSVSHSGLYFVGLPCAHNLTSGYLFGMARDSRRVAEAIARSLR